MKRSFTFKRWYWADEDDRPQWWINLLHGRSFNEVYKELSKVAKVREKMNGSVRVVFKTEGDLAFFILRWS